MIIPPYFAPVRLPLEYHVQVWAPQYKNDMHLLEQVQHWATEVIKCWEHLSHEEKQRELGLFCLERSQGDLVNLNKYLLGGNQEEEVRLFSLVPTDRIRGNGKKLKILKFHLNARKHFFTMWCGQAWEQLVERGCEVSILSGIQNSTRPPFRTTYSSWSYLNWGVGLHEFKKSLPTSTILCFSELILLFD